MENLNEVVVPPKRKKLNADLVFREELFNNLKSLYETQNLCNVILIVGVSAQRISAHHAILAAASSYFRRTFENDAIERAQIEMVLKDIDGHSLKEIIDFCYSGIIDVNETSVGRILETATQLEFSYIQRKCNRFLWGNLSITNGLLVWSSMTPDTNLKEVRKSVLGFIEKHFTDVVNQPEFFQLDAEHLFELLKSDDLNIWSEEEVFHALLKWTEYDENGRKDHVKKLLSAIRLTHLKSHFLYQTVTNFCGRFECSDLIKDVYLWKIIPESQPHPMVPRSATVSTTRLLALGNGYDSSMRDRCSELYDPILNQWNIFEQFLCERNRFCSAIVDNDLYILGGYCPNEKSVVKLVLKFNFASNNVSNEGSMKEAREWFAVAVLNDDIYAAGGTGLDSVEKYNVTTRTWTEIPSMTQQRSYFCMVTLNGKLYAIAGSQDTDTGQDLSSVECYDPFENQWKLKATMNRKRCAHGAFAHNKFLYVVGGLSDGRIEASVEYYDHIIDKWTVVEVLTVPRFGFGLAMFENYVVIGGGKVSENKPQSSIITINVNSLKREEVPMTSSMKIERYYFHLIQVPKYNSTI